MIPKQKYPPKYSKAMKEEIKKMDEFSNSVRFLSKYKITTLTEVRKYKTNATTEINELKSKRENLWKRHKKIKTDEEGQFICSEIQELATKIIELNKNIKLCDFIENRTLMIKKNIKDMRQEEKVKLKYTDRDYR